MKKYHITVPQQKQLFETLKIIIINANNTFLKDHVWSNDAENVPLQDKIQF